MQAFSVDLAQKILFCWLSISPSTTFSFTQRLVLNVGLGMPTISLYGT